MEEQPKVAIYEMTPFLRWVRKNRLTPAVEKLKDELRENPDTGDVIPGGSGLRKVRMGGLGRGKQGGFRVIYFLTLNRTIAVLLTGYSKSEREDLTAEEVRDFAAQLDAITATLAVPPPEEEP